MEAVGAVLALGVAMFLTMDSNHLLSITSLDSF
jgi:hypothetical protein